MSNIGKKSANTVTGAKKISKQGNLFSFFSKKEKPAKCTEPQQHTLPSVQSPHKTKSFSVSNPATLPEQISQQEPHRPIPQISSPGEIPSNQVKIGDFIKVFWEDDDEWYEAMVTKQKGTTSTYFIQYSIDGQSEWIDLSTESFRLLTDNTRESQNCNILSVHHDNDDCSDENEYVSSSSDDDAESGINDGDQWMVTDDEDEIVPKKKQKINSTLAAGAIDPKAQRKQNHTGKKSRNTMPSLTHYAAPMTATQHSYDKSGKTSPRTAQTISKSLTTPKHITPMTAASGQLSANSNASFCSSTVQSSGNNNIATPLATAQSLLKTPKMNGSPKILHFEVGALNPAGSHVHNHLPFLQYPRDSHGRTSDDPNYDSRTIQIQERDWIRIVGKKMTDAVKQWWDLKAMYFDTVLLFKTGKWRLQNFSSFLRISL